MKKNKLKLGQFIMGDSIIHKLDPRTKILGCLFIISSTIFSSNIIVILMNLFTLVLVILLSEISVLRFFMRMKPLLILFLLTFSFQSILTKGESLFSIGAISVTREGVSLGIITVFRLLILYMCSTILTITTSPMKLTSGLELLFRPLEILHVPVHQLSMIISISLRFIPTIIEEADTIKCAQKSRGAQIDSKNLVVKIRAMSAVLIPILATSLQRAGDLAIAMESRCYTAQSRTHHTAGLHLGKRDIVAIGIVLIVFAVCFVYSK